MKTAIKIMILLVALSNSAMSEDRDTLSMSKFPLRNQTWLIGKGYNHRVYPSFTGAVPTHVVMVTFPNDDNGDISMKWANLTGLNFKSTAHLLNEVNYQFSRMENNLKKPYREAKDSVLSISRRNVPDTVWSCDEYFNKNSASSGYWGVRDVADTSGKFVRWTPSYKGTYYKSKPICVEIINYERDNPLDKKAAEYIYTGKLNDTTISAKYRRVRYYNSMNVNEAEKEFIDYCDKERCYEYQSKAPKPAVPDFKFYQIHLFPLTKWYPRQQPRSGQPMLNDSLVMNMFVARDRRIESIRRINNIGDTGAIFYPYYPDTSYMAQWIWYRSPYYSDSASTVVSAQFFWDGISPVSSKHLKTSMVKDDPSYRDKGFEGFYINRLPDRIVKLNNTSSYEVGLGVLRLYAESDDDDAKIVRMYSECPDWKSKDITIGNKYRFPEVRDEYWKVKKGDGNYYEPTDHINGGTLVDLTDVDSNYVENRYVYNGCPCLQIDSLNGYTASDLRSFLYRTPPLCDEMSMSNALYVLWAAWKDKHITDKSDVFLLKRRAVQIGTALLDKAKFNARIRKEFPQTWTQKINDAVSFCPQTWEVNFRDTARNAQKGCNNFLYTCSYDLDLRNFVRSVFNEVKDSVAIEDARRKLRTEARKKMR